MQKGDKYTVQATLFAQTLCTLHKNYFVGRCVINMERAGMEPFLGQFIIHSRHCLDVVHILEV